MDRYPNVIKVLAPLIENPNRYTAYCTPMHIAAHFGNEEALKVLVTFADNLDVVDNVGANVMQLAAKRGNVNMLRFLAPLMKNPNKPNICGQSATEIANWRGHVEFARILQSYIKSYIELDLD